MNEEIAKQLKSDRWQYETERSSIEKMSREYSDILVPLLLAVLDKLFFDH